jgi:hypothetical protein
LELLQGTSKVWGLTERARGLLEAMLAHETAHVRTLAMTLRSMADMCIYRPGARLPPGPDAAGGADSTDPDAMKAREAAERAGRRQRRGRSGDGGGGGGGGNGDEPGAGDECGDAQVRSALQQRDPHYIGLPSAQGRALLRALLAWEPSERITPAEALAHPYFED